MCRTTDGGGIFLQLVLMNAGAVGAPASEVELRCTSGERAVAWREPVPALGPGQRRTVAADPRQGRPVRQGPARGCQIVADPADRVAETDERNNLLVCADCRL